MTETIQEIAYRLATARFNLEVQRDIVRVAEQALESTTEYQNLSRHREALADLAQVEQSVKVELSETMLAEAKITGVVKWDFGQVINTKTVHINDEAKALAWAIERKIALQLDAKAIKKVAETLHPDGVEIVEGKATRINSEIVVPDSVERRQGA